MRTSRWKLLAGFLFGLLLLGTATYQALAARQETKDPPQPPTAAVAAPVVDGEEKKITIKELPPVVVQSVPRAGDTEVDADKVTELRVTFSKDMADGTWSWSMIGKDTFPTTTGKPHYDKDKRTCVLPVKLQPGKTYAIWVNSEKFSNFQDGDGLPAVPYLLAFQTKAAK